MRAGLSILLFIAGLICLMLAILAAVGDADGRAGPLKRKLLGLALLCAGAAMAIALGLP
jgi:hypothetical protein